MGGGSWTTSSFCSYSTSRGRSVDDTGFVTTSYASAQDMYEQRRMHERMDPKKFMVRECRDSDEHPNTLPVILAIDVTGSMGDSAMAVAKSLNGIVTDISEKSKDTEFCVMAIGDTYCDKAPVQMSQFESDVRIAQAFDDIWFEGGGGSNPWESYTAAWYMAAYHTELDAWKRGGKGVLITLGDEPINPILEPDELRRFIKTKGDELRQDGDIDSRDLYKVVSDKYDVYHIYVDHRSESKNDSPKEVTSFEKIIGKDHVFSCRVKDLPKVVSKIVLEHASTAVAEPSAAKVDQNGDIDW